MIRSFDSERALSYVEIWGKNLFVAEGYLIDEERKEGERRTRASGTWRHLWRKDHRERNIGVKTKTSSWEGYKVAVACTLSVSFRGGIILNRLQIIAFHF